MQTMNANNPYEARVIITFPPASGAEPTGDLKYYNPDGSPALSPLSVRENEKLLFSLWQESSPPGNPTPLNGDLVLIAQYYADPITPKKPKGRKSPFNGGDLAIYLEQQLPNKWTVNLKLNGAAGDSQFEYGVLALLEGGLVKVLIDPTIIIRPTV